MFLKLKLGDAALRIEVNPSAVNPLSSPATHVYSCLQEHITKLQVKRLDVFQLLKPYNFCGFKMINTNKSTVVTMTSVFALLSLQAVSVSLKTLVDTDTSSVKDSTSDNVVTLACVKEQTSENPHSSKATESKTAADDIMVQIKAGKSEVGFRQRICQLFWQ